MVFREPAAAAGFAVDLVARMEAVDWAGLGLPEKTTVRVGLHAGPVFEGNDPIIERTSYFGGHVSLAARVEPITPPGCVFATEAFFCRLLAGTRWRVRWQLCRPDGACRKSVARLRYIRSIPDDRLTIFSRGRQLSCTFKKP